jgi:hypothetical protein
MPELPVSLEHFKNAAFAGRWVTALSIFAGLLS